MIIFVLTFMNSRIYRLVRSMFIKSLPQELVLYLLFVLTYNMLVGDDIPIHQFWAGQYITMGYYGILWDTMGYHGTMSMIHQSRFPKKRIYTDLINKNLDMNQADCADCRNSPVPGDN
jgi:hypothetical protein